MSKYGKIITSTKVLRKFFITAVGAHAGSAKTVWPGEYACPRFPRVVKTWEWDLPGGLVVKTPCFHCRGHGFDPWGTKILHAARCGHKNKNKNKTKNLAVNCEELNPA